MITPKLTQITLFLMLGMASCVNAAQEGEVAIQRSPTSSPFRDMSFHQNALMPSSPSKVVKQPRSLKLEGPLLATELNQLKEKSCIEINLVGVYEAYEREGDFFEKGPLHISPDTINPDVVSLSLKGCGLTDDHIKNISKFKSLKRLNLEGNRITNEAISYITQLEGLEYLSLAVTQISDLGLEQLVKMPSLIGLDVTHNKGITDNSQKLLSASMRLKIDYRFTSVTDKTPRGY